MCMEKHKYFFYIGNIFRNKFVNVMLYIRGGGGSSEFGLGWFLPSNYAYSIAHRTKTVACGTL